MPLLSNTNDNTFPISHWTKGWENKYEAVSHVIECKRRGTLSDEAIYMSPRADGIAI